MFLSLNQSFQIFTVFNVHKGEDIIEFKYLGNILLVGKY